METNNTESLQRELESLAAEWSESKYEGAQATHVFAHPVAKEFGSRPEEIPFMLKRLETDITWAVPLMSAVEELGVDLNPEVDHSLDAKPTGNLLQDKLSHLEGERQAILNWAKENAR